MRVRFSGVSYGSEALIKQGYSLAEEIANSVSHGIGLVLVSLGWCCYWFRRWISMPAPQHNQLQPLWRSMILLFLASTLYHAIPHQRAKMWLKKLTIALFTC
ncbi:hemolysin (membrane protein) [Escherichia coli]|uniref:Hemolysin ( membrane protein) n=1 Tax=Escherichia coli TaxID=562 RepID=A0A376UG98_ECOLX|nr:hemolysin (membrane protein) [Escherichia coli]